MTRLYLIIFSILGISIFFGGCKKDEVITDTSVMLNFSTDTLSFDTVFTTRGSTTEFIRLFNPENQKVIISSIELAGGEDSPYRINVDGVNGIRHENVEILAEDSLYIFVEVTIDRNENENLPFFVKDSIEFITNGNIQDVKLTAWGQDAHYFVPDNFDGPIPPFSILECNTTWTNDKPYVISGYLVVDTDCKLTIEPGTRVHFATGGALLMFESTLEAIGTAADSITFQGDRLESFYNDLPGQWDGLQFSEGSKNNILEHVEISGAINSISVNFPSVNGNPNLILNNTVVKHSSGYGIFSLGSEIEMTNCLLYDAGVNLMLMASGGIYDIRHCTFNSFGSFFNEHDDPAVAMSDFLQIGENAFTGPLNVSMQNCIIHGSLQDELSIIDNEGEPLDFNVSIQQALIQLEAGSSEYVTNGIFNENPQFENTSEQDFHLQPTSPAVNAGVLVDVFNDLDGRVRDAQPDLGCYEYYE